MRFSERFNFLLENRAVKKLDVAKHCGVSKSTVTRWSSGRNVPNANQLAIIANLLEASPDYLLGVTDDITLDYREILLVKIMRLDVFDQKRVYDFINTLTSH